MALWRMFITVTILVSMFCVGVLAAGDIQEGSLSIQSEILSVQSRVVGLPLSGMVASYFGDETINIHVTAANGEDFVLGIESKDSVISTFAITELVNPDVDVYMDESTLTDLVSGKDIKYLLGVHLANGAIEYTAHGFLNKIKYAIVVSRVRA